MRKHVGYNRDFLDGYRPNVTAYLSAKEREHLRKIGTPRIADQPAGTYAKLKKPLADAMLDNAALKDLLSKKW